MRFSRILMIKQSLVNIALLQELHLSLCFLRSLVVLELKGIHFMKCSVLNTSLCCQQPKVSLSVKLVCIVAALFYSYEILSFFSGFPEISE